MLNLAAEANERGSTLMEVLVSIVIISVALLGAGALQGKALKSGKDGYLLSKAGFLIDDISERIRVNSSAAHPASTNYNMLGTMTDYASLPASYKATMCLGALANCTPSEIGAYDVAQWLAVVGHATKGLPGGATKIVWSGKDAEITLRWLPSYAGEGNCDSDGTIGLTEQGYRCLSLVVSVP